ncbi:MAG: MFS transporter [Gaiellales bacterium]
MTRSRLLGLGIALALADSSVVTLALPDILKQFELEIADVAWVLTLYNLGLAAAAIPAAYAARRRPAVGFAAGTIVFAVASLACGLASSYSWLLAGRSVQAVGGALLVCASLELLCQLESSEPEAVRLWATAGLVGAAVGPAAGGILTETLGWESIFLVQAPLSLLTLVGLRGIERAAHHVPAGRPALPANLALLLLSGALTAALFLLVLLLVDGWGLTPIAAGVVVTVMPLAMVAVRGVAERLGDGKTRAATGTILVAGGLGALAIVPGASWVWAVPPQLLIGAGLGLAVSALTEWALAGRAAQAIHGGWTIAARHAGVVLGLVLLTPVFTSALDTNRHQALEAGAAAVLDSTIPPAEKISLAQDVLSEVAAAKGELPDLSKAFVDRPQTPEYRTLEASLLDELERGITAAFRAPFALAAMLALAVLIPVGIDRRRA